MTEIVRGRASLARARRYRGGCQCGAVLWEVELDLRASEQDVSSVWQRSVQARLFSLLRGHEGLRGYQYFDDSAHHFFCAVCGAHAFSHMVAPAGDPSCDRYVVDLRCVEAPTLPTAADRAVVSS